MEGMNLHLPKAWENEGVKLKDSGNSLSDACDKDGYQHSDTYKQITLNEKSSLIQERGILISSVLPTGELLLFLLTNREMLALTDYHHHSEHQIFESSNMKLYT